MTAPAHLLSYSDVAIWSTPAIPQSKDSGSSQTFQLQNTPPIRKDRDKERMLFFLRKHPKSRSRRRAPGASVPGLPADLLPVADERGAMIKPGTTPGVADPAVGPAALGARERTQRDQPRQRMGILEQPGQALARAHDARVAPQRRAGGGVRGRRRRERAQRLELLPVRRCRLGRRLRQRARYRAAGEHEALAQRVGGEAIGAVQTG